MHRFIERDLAFAAVAAPEALFAKMIGASVLGAAGADLRGKLPANIAGKSHNWVLLLSFGISSGRTGSGRRRLGGQHATAALRLAVHDRALLFALRRQVDDIALKTI